MKKIWSKTSKSRPRSRPADDDPAPADDALGPPHIRLLIHNDYDAHTVKHAWVNAVLNTLSREVSESQFRLLRAELRGSHLCFFRPPTLVDARLLRLDMFDAAALDGAADHSGRKSLDSASLAPLGACTLVGSVPNVSDASGASGASLAAVNNELRLSRPDSVFGVASCDALAPTSSPDRITYFSPRIPHPALQFDPAKKRLLQGSSPEALAHFLLFADAHAMDAPLRTVVCVVPMMPNVAAVLRALHTCLAALYIGKYGPLVPTVEPTWRVLRLLSHMAAHFKGVFLRAEPAALMLRFQETWATHAPPELAPEISAFPASLLAIQDQLLALVEEPNTPTMAEDPFVDLSGAVFMKGIELFAFAEAVTAIDLAFFRVWNASTDRSLLLALAFLDAAPGDLAYKRNPLLFDNRTHLHYLLRLLVHHLFEEKATLPAMRARILEKWIDVGCLLDKLGNMSLWLGICSVVLSQPVLRLTSVWRHVSDDYIALLRDDWVQILFELDRRDLATPIESVIFGSASGADIHTTFKDSFHVMMPRGFGKIYPKDHMVPYFGDLLVKNLPNMLPDELEAVWNKMDYSFKRWNKYVDKLHDCDDLIAYNRAILRHYDSNGFIFSNLSLNQVLCLGAKKDLSMLLHRLAADNGIAPPKGAAAMLETRLNRLLRAKCDSMSLEAVMRLSLALEPAAPENYLKPAPLGSSNSAGAVDEALPPADALNADAPEFVARLSGTNGEEKLPLFVSNAFKIDFEKYDAVPEPVEIKVDAELVLRRGSFALNLDGSRVEELVETNEPHGGLVIDFDNIFNYEKSLNLSLENLAPAEDDDSTNRDRRPASLDLKRMSIHSVCSARYVLMSASVDRLIDLLVVDPKNFDDTAHVELSEYRMVFMMNYSSFLSTHDFLVRLAHRFVNSGNAVISMMKRRNLVHSNKYDAAALSAYPNWDFDKDVDVSALGTVDYALLLRIQTNILQVLHELVNKFFSSFLNDLANKSTMIKLLKLYSNEILQWYNSSKISCDLDPYFKLLVTCYKRVKKAFVTKTYRPMLPSCTDEFLMRSFDFSSKSGDVPINRNLPSHRDMHKVEKFLNKFNELLGTFYRGITPHHWFTLFKVFERQFERGLLLNYSAQKGDVSEDALRISNVYDYLLTLHDLSPADRIFSSLPVVFQHLLRLFAKFRSYLLIQLCDVLVGDDERLERMRTLLIMVRICRLKMGELHFVLDGDAGPIPSFIEAAIANAVYAPESRYLAQLWVRAAASVSASAVDINKRFDSLLALIPSDISADDLSSRDPLLPCVGWVVENMLDLNQRPSFHGPLLNYNKRYVLFLFVKALIVEDAQHDDPHPASKEFDFLFLLKESLPHMSNLIYDSKQYPRGFFEKVIRQQYHIIAIEAQRAAARRPSTDGSIAPVPRTLTKKMSSSSLRRQSFPFKGNGTSKFRLGGLFTKPKAFAVGTERVVSVRDLPDCLSVADARQKPVLAIPLKNRKIFPVYLLPACFKIDLDGTSEFCLLQASSEADARDWVHRLNYANRHWFLSRAINTRLAHACTTFGVPLSFVCARDNADVPAVLSTIFLLLEADGLGEVGIYRIGTSLSELASLKAEIDRTGTISADADRAHDVHALTSCVKLFFRELPDALLTDDVIEALQPASRPRTSTVLPEPDLDAYRALLARLPHVNYCTLRLLIRHLHTVYVNQQRNKMSSSNLAMVIGPALTEASNLDALINNFGAMNHVLEWLIEKYEAIFCDDVD